MNENSQPPCYLVYKIVQSQFGNIFVSIAFTIWCGTTKKETFYFFGENLKQQLLERQSYSLYQHLFVHIEIAREQKDKTLSFLTFSYFFVLVLFQARLQLEFNCKVIQVLRKKRQNERSKELNLMLFYL